MTDDEQKILDTLWRLRQDPACGLEGSLEGVALSVDEGQVLQLKLLDRWREEGFELGGWKIGMTSGESRNALGDGIRPFGYLLEHCIKPSGATLRLNQLHRGQVENELCFIIGRHLGAGATVQDVKAGISGCAPAFEINQKRLAATASPGIRVADDLSNWGIVIGESVPPLDDLSGLNVTLSNDDGEISTVASAGHIDDHYESLVTLANRLGAFGRELEPGQRVITGAYGKTPFAEGTFQGEFSLHVGSVSVEITS